MENVYLNKLWVNKKVDTIKWSEFFQVIPNEYKVFKLIPHLNVSNNQNRDLWSTLHKSFDLYHSMHQRTDFSFKTGLKIRKKDYIWLDMIFRVKGTQKQIEFYMSTTETMAKKFKHMLENKLAVTIEESTIENIQVPTENVVIHELKYVHHDIFSLNTNHQKQTALIAPLLNTLEEMDQDGDYARISMLNEREDRVKWGRNALYAYEKVKKGKVPQRANLSPKKVKRSTVKVIGGILNEVNSVIQDTINAFQNVVFNSDDKAKGKLIDKKSDLLNELGTTDIGAKVNSKINSPVWKSHIRVAVHSKDKFNRDNVSNSIAAAYSELSEHNELESKKIRFRGRRNEVIKELNTLQPTNKTLTDPDTNHISCDEMGKLWQLPTSSLQQKYEDCMKSNRKVETDIPSIFIHKQKKERVKINDIEISIGSNKITYNDAPLNVLKKKDNHIPIGFSEVKGNRIPIGIPLNNPNELYKAFVLMGGMNAGKDGLIQNMVKEGNDRGVSYVIIDQVNKEGLEGMANGIRDTISKDKIIDIDLSDENHLPPLDLTEVMKKLGKRGADRFANELIEFMEVDDMGQSRKILRDFGKACNGSLYQLNELLINEEFRMQRVKELQKEGNLRVADAIGRYISTYEVNSKGEYKCTFDGQKSLDGKASAIINRLDTFLGDDTLYSIFAQPPKKEFTLSKWIQEGKVIIFRVPDRILSTLAVRTLVHWITLQVLMTRLLMTNEEQSGGCFIAYNEPQTYLKDNKGLATLLSRIAVQGRKERLGSIFACHHIGQLSEISEDLISGGVHFVLLKSENKKTFERLEEMLKPTFSVESALGVENTKTTRHAILILNFGGKTQPAFLVELLKPSYQRYETYDNSYLTKRHSRMFGRTIEEIEKMLVQLSS